MQPSRVPKRGFGVDATRLGKGTKILVVAADNSLPLAASVQSGQSPDETSVLASDCKAGQRVGRCWSMGSRQGEGTVGFAVHKAKAYSGYSCSVSYDLMRS
jgi:hypothetical protein